MSIDAEILDLFSDQDNADLSEAVSEILPALPMKLINGDRVDNGDNQISPESGTVEQIDTIQGLSPRQVKLMQTLLDRELSDTNDDVARKVGISRSTYYRMVADRVFADELTRQTRLRLKSHRGAVANALVRGACTPGMGQAAMQRTYWTLAGEFDLPVVEEDPIKTLAELLGITVEEFRAYEVQEKPLDCLSLDAKRQIIMVIEMDKTRSTTPGLIESCYGSIFKGGKEAVLQELIAVRMKTEITPIIGDIAPIDVTPNLATSGASELGAVSTLSEFSEVRE